MGAEPYGLASGRSPQTGFSKNMQSTKSEREQLESEIRRRIRNRLYENHDICSLRQGGPGLAELSGLPKLMSHLDRESRLSFARELADIKPALRSCARCEAKLHAILYLILRHASKGEALMHLEEMCGRMAFLRRQGESARDFLWEVEEAERSNPLPRDLALLSVAGMDRRPSIPVPEPHRPVALGAEKTPRRVATAKRPKPKRV